MRDCFSGETKQVTFTVDYKFCEKSSIVSGDNEVFVGATQNVVTKLDKNN